jgi:hypothetical protein
MHPGRGSLHGRRPDHPAAFENEVTRHAAAGAAPQGEAVTLATWIAGFGDHMPPRRCLAWRPADRQVLVRADPEAR